MRVIAVARRSPSAMPRIIDAAAAVCLLAGNTIGALLFPPEWTIAGVFPPVFVGVALVAFRCVRYPTPSMLDTWRPRGAAPTRTRAIVLVALTTRLAVLLVGLNATLSHPARFSMAPYISENPVINLPARWDAFWYLGIARYGYEPRPTREDQQHNIAFFPAYPAAMRIAGDLAAIPAHLFRSPHFLGNGDGRVLWGGVVAVVGFFTLALLRLQRLADAEVGPQAALRACVLLATYPFALFFSAPYSEALALLALVSLVLAWQQRDARGALWGLLFGLTRSNGWCVAVALAVDHLFARRPARTWAVWLTIASAPLGAALYSAYVYHLTGHPFAWATAQHAWVGEFTPLHFVTRRWDEFVHRGWRGYVRYDPSDLLTFFAALGMVLASVSLLIRRQWLYALLILAYLAPAVAIDLPATGRMTALLFPAFILLGERLTGVRFVATVVLFGAGQVWMASRFFTWRTPY